MRARNVAAMTAVVLAAGGCGTPSDEGEPASPGPSASAAAGDEVPWCEEVPEVAAPESVYRDTPVYVANEQPAEQVQAWAAEQGAFESLMLDRDHNGWIVLVFSSGDRTQLQAAVEQAFPDEGVAVVVVDRTRAELEAIQARVGEVLDGDWGAGTGNARFVVEIDLGVARPERIAAVNAAFAGEPVCITGRDPAAEPTPGPQPTEGEGWRLLGTEPVGEPYRTGIATDQDTFAGLWAQVGMTADRPDVNFDREVVVWFGAVYSGSCPDLRMDNVVIGDLVHMETSLLGDHVACTDDANPRAFMVAVDRGHLPSDGFAIQLGPDDPPGGAPEERTIVEADLTAPGSTPPPGSVGPDPAHDPEPIQDAFGAYVEPGFPSEFRLSLGCGAGWIRNLNGVDWTTDAPQADQTWIPPAWAELENDSIVAVFEVTTGDPPTLTVTANGHTQSYTPGSNPPTCDPGDT